MPTLLMGVDGDRDAYLIAYDPHDPAGQVDPMSLMNSSRKVCKERDDEVLLMARDYISVSDRRIMPKFTPIWWEPKGLSAGQAATHLGISRTKFDELVKDGRMPQPHCVDGRRLWDRREVEECFEMLPRAPSAEIEPWGQMEV